MLGDGAGFRHHPVLPVAARGGRYGLRQRLLAFVKVLGVGDVERDDQLLALLLVRQSSPWKRTVNALEDLEAWFNPGHLAGPQAALAVEQHAVSVEHDCLEQAAVRLDAFGEFLQLVIRHHGKYRIRRMHWRLGAGVDYFYSRSAQSLALVA